MVDEGIGAKNKHKNKQLIKTIFCLLKAIYKLCLYSYLNRYTTTQPIRCRLVVYNQHIQNAELYVAFGFWLIAFSEPCTMCGRITKALPTLVSQ